MVHEAVVVNGNDSVTGPLAAHAQLTTATAAALAPVRPVDLGRPPDLARSLAWCATTTRDRARNFYYGLRLTPEPRRSAIYSIYAWMREADDLADDAGDPEVKLAKLDAFEKATERALAGSGGAHVSFAQGGPFANGWPALADTVDRYPVDRRIFRDMLIGLRADVGGVELVTDAELDDYCYRVASTAGLACIWVWGLRDSSQRNAAEQQAIWRGQAFQRTNILRDLREDLLGEPRRVYVPRARLNRHGLNASGLAAWHEPRACRDLVESLIADAHEYYRRSAGLDDLIDPACAPTLWAMTRIYRGILDRIEARPESIARPERIRVSSAAKTGIMLRALASSRFRRA